MNFFNSVFSDDPDPPKPESGSSNADPGSGSNSSPGSDSSPGSGDGGDRWNFGGLIKTITAKSESIIETYRRDLQEFGTGLKSEIEVAHGSVGHVIDEFGNTVIKGTAQIISQGKDAILAVNLDPDSDNSNRTPGGGEKGSGSSKRYSRFDSQVRAIQGDASSYTDAPEDLSAFEKWKSEFSLDGKREEIEGFFKENEAMESVYKRVVPNAIDDETFWYRYYYKVYRLKKAEDVRARLVRRMSREEEELSWDFEEDVDDEDEKAFAGGGAKPEVGGENVEKKVDAQLQSGSSGATDNEGEAKQASVEEVQHLREEEIKVEGKDNLLQSKEIGNEVEKSVQESRDEKSEVGNEIGGGSKEDTKEEGGAVDKASKSPVGGGASKDNSAAESDGKVVREMEGGDGKSSSKNNEPSGVESKNSANVEEEEEDLGWDEIEDLSNVDEKKATQSGSSTSQVDLRKRLSAAEEDEDLSWDIEDDDEPAKA